MKQLVDVGKTVIIIGRVPVLRGYDRSCEEKRVKAFFAQCNAHFLGARLEVDTVNRVVREVSETNGRKYIDFNDLLCAGNDCSSELDGVTAYFESSHLSGRGSELLGGEAIKDTSVVRFFPGSNL